MAAAPNVLAIDMGSSSVRARLYGPDAEVLPRAETRVEHRVTYGEDGGAELDPEALLDRVSQAVDHTMGVARRDGHAVHAVATSAMWHGVCGVDGSGQVTVPVLTWADRRSAPAAAELRDLLDERSVHARTGCRLHSSYLPAKLRWLAEAHPGRHARTAYWLAPPDYVHQRLFGSVTTSVSIASGCGLLDQRTFRYDPELLAAVLVDPRALPPVCDEPLRGLLSPWRERWPELADVPWFPPLGDGAASNLGVGCVRRDQLALMVGTSGAARVLWEADEFDVPDAVWCYRLDRSAPVMGGAVNDGGGLLAWLRDTVRVPDLTTSERELEQMPPGGHGLTILPLLAGERSPGWRDTAAGAVLGLTQATRPVDLLRAGYEAVAMRMAQVVTEVEQALGGIHEVIGTGAALRGSRVLRQIMADAMGRPFVSSGAAEASSRGAALWALRELGVVGSLGDLPAPTTGVTDPRPEHHEAYLQMRATQDRLCDLLTDPAVTGPRRSP